MPEKPTRKRPRLPLPAAPAARGQVLDAQLSLLDRQVLDRSDTPVTTVDDIEIADPPEGPIAVDAAPPVITAIVTGPVLGTRIFGGRLPTSRFIRIPWTDVSDVGTVVRLGVDGESLDATWTERWVRDHVIRRIPGGSHDPE
ncbi:hypothetical protein [Agreia sp.]|uniref:hypothetical protein n=1 Tax=Agreia sp. TaxID=1872416 RepID=UPI0035BC9288